MPMAYFFPQAFFLSWFAFVPLLFSIRGATIAQSYCLGAIAGFTCFIIGAYWIYYFIINLKGYTVLHSAILSMIFLIYCSQLCALALCVFSWLKKVSTVHEVILFPLVITVFYAFYPQLFSAQFSSTQSQFLVAIQAIEYTGIYGLDFIVATSNILIYRFVSQKGKFPDPVALFFSATVVIWLIYGFLALSYWDNKIATWDETTLALVQPNEKPSSNIPPPLPGYSRAFPPEMALSIQLAAQGAKFIIWPETRYKGYFRYEHVREAFSTQIKKMGVSVLFQDTENETTEGKFSRYNTAIWLNTQGNFSGSYRKIKRVAFGEYLPVFDTTPKIKIIFRRFFGNFFSDFQAGDGPAVFTIKGIQFVPLICYEVMFPRFVAQSLPEKPQGVVIVTQSSNGWFGETIQPYQHLHSSVFRSVENRLPLIHVVNNGPSGVVLPSGRLVFQSAYHQAGAYQVSMPYQSEQGGSFFSQHPNWFILTVLFVLISIILFSLFFGKKT